MHNYFEMKFQRNPYTYYEVQLIVLSRYIVRNEPSADRTDTLILYY